MVLISFSFDCTIRLTILQTHVNSFCACHLGDWHFLNVRATLNQINFARSNRYRAKLSRMICRMRNSKSLTREQTIVECSLWNWKIIWRMIKKPLSSSRGEAHTKSNLGCQRVQWLLCVVTRWWEWMGKKVYELRGNCWNVFTFDRGLEITTKSSQGCFPGSVIREILIEFQNAKRVLIPHLVRLADIQVLMLCKQLESYFWSWRN